MIFNDLYSNLSENLSTETVVRIINPILFIGRYEEFEIRIQVYFLVTHSSAKLQASLQLPDQGTRRARLGLWILVRKPKDTQ